MDNLIHSIKELSKENFPNHKVYDLLENYTLPQNEIQDYILFDNDKYTRHLIHKDDDFEILIMCWRPGHKAPIHGHEGEKMLYARRERIIALYKLRSYLKRSIRAYEDRFS